MNVLITDLESVLIPEIWVEVAKKFGVKELEKTTREFPDYKKLMDYRIDILKEKNIDFEKIKTTVSEMEPLPHAKDFLDTVSNYMPVVIVSGSFFETAGIIVKQLGNYTLIANNLTIENGYIQCCDLRMNDNKNEPVEFFKGLGFNTIGVGDSFNDLPLLKSSDSPILFDPSEKIRDKISDANEAKDLKELEKKVLKIIGI